MEKIKQMMSLLEKPKNKRKRLLTVNPINKENNCPNSSRLQYINKSKSRDLEAFKKSFLNNAKEKSFFLGSYRSINNTRNKGESKLSRLVPKLAYVSRIAKKSNKTHIMLTNIIKGESHRDIKKNSHSTHRIHLENKNQVSKNLHSFRIGSIDKIRRVGLKQLNTAILKRKGKAFNLNKLKKTFLKIPANPQNCLHYVPNIFKHILFREQSQLRINLKGFDRQREINKKMRLVLYDWLINVSTDFKLKNRTLFLAIDLIELFLMNKQVSKAEYQLVGIAALFMASKYEEIYPPPLKAFSTTCDNFYTHKQIIDCETQILLTINFDMSRVLVFDFFEMFAASIGLEKRAHCYGLYILHLITMEMSFVSVSKAILAVSLCYVLTRLFNINWKLRFVTHKDRKFIKFSLLNKQLCQLKLKLLYGDEQDCAFPEKEVKTISRNLAKLIRHYRNHKDSGAFKRFEKDLSFKQALLKMKVN